jgi:hypothetical protein
VEKLTKQWGFTENVWNTFCSALSLLNERQKSENPRSSLSTTNSKSLYIYINHAAKISAIKFCLSIDLINSTIRYIRTSITYCKVITNSNLTLYISKLQYTTRGIKTNFINIDSTQIRTSWD